MARTTRRSTHCPGREARGRTLRFHPVRLSTKGRSLSWFALDRRAKPKLRVASPDPRLEPKLRGGSPAAPRFEPKLVPVRLWIPAFGRNLEQFTVRIIVPAEAMAIFPECGAGRSLCMSPSGHRVRPKPWRFAFSETPCRPKLVGSSGRNPVPAEAGRWSRLDRRQSRSPGGSPPKRRAGRGRSVSPVRIPFGAEARSGSPLAVP